MQTIVLDSKPYMHYDIEMHLPKTNNTSFINTILRLFSNLVTRN